MNQNKCLYNYYFGFQNHHSTNLALISITEERGIIRGMPLKLFQSPNVLPINYGVPQESVLWSTPIPYINDLNGAATHSKVHHFADDTTMLFYQFCERCKQKGQL